jgi:hypothetical protein
LFSLTGLVTLRCHLFPHEAGRHRALLMMRRTNRLAQYIGLSLGHTALDDFLARQVISA